MTERADEGDDWQRLDKWLWCARFMKARSECAQLVAGGLIRINRQPTDKPHARLRVGDILTVPLRGDVRVVRVLALARRRGPAPEARGLYESVQDPSPQGPSPSGPSPSGPSPVSCAAGDSSAYRRA